MRKDFTILLLLATMVLVADEALNKERSLWHQLKNQISR